MMDSEIRYIPRQIVNENVPSANAVARIVCRSTSTRKKCVVIMKAMISPRDLPLGVLERNYVVFISYPRRHKYLKATLNILPKFLSR